jgi:hypothetical protein
MDDISSDIAALVRRGDVLQAIQGCDLPHHLGRPMPPVKRACGDPRALHMVRPRPTAGMSANKAPKGEDPVQAL